MSLVPLALHLRESGNYARFQEACRDPRAAQAAVLQRIVEANAGTAFGRDHGFGRAAKDWHKAVPIRDYEKLRPYMERVVAGESGVLTADAPCMFTTTSGTTGSPKMIPVTAAWRNQMGALLRLWMLKAQADHPGCFAGQVLTVVSPAVEGRTPSGIPYGAMTGVTSQKAPWLLRRQYPAPYAVSLIKDYEARYQLIMRLALAKQVSAIVTPNPSTLMRLSGVAERHGEAIVKAIHDGTLGMPWPDLLSGTDRTESAAKAEIMAALRPDPARARELGKLMETHGALLPRFAWPGLKLIGCWLGGSAGLHARALADVYGETVALRDVGLLASEGRMTVPLSDDTSAGPLYVHANYYEFIPEAAIEELEPPVLGAHELVDGGRYYIVLTGANGLYRYDMNDVVEVRGFFHHTPQVAFVRKGRDMVNITGEKLHLNQVQQAVREAERAAGLAVWQFQLIPDAVASGYDLLLETRPATPAAGVLSAFATAFDASLSRLNMEYEGKRASGRLQAPRLHLMTEGWTERASRREMATGKRDVQFKWPHLRQTWELESREEVAFSPTSH
jgi:hypothetical protein